MYAVTWPRVMHLPKNVRRVPVPAGSSPPLSEPQKLTYNREKFDILLINGSNHRSDNTGYMMDLVEEILRERGVSYRRYNPE
jgi:hypothetical protein